MIIFPSVTARQTGKGEIMDEWSDIETLAREAHKVYCDQYYLNHEEEYWTKGNYDLLDEKTKDYDRALARHYQKKLFTLLASSKPELDEKEVESFLKSLNQTGNVKGKLKVKYEGIKGTPYFQFTEESVDFLSKALVSHFSVRREVGVPSMEELKNIITYPEDHNRYKYRTKFVNIDKLAEALRHKLITKDKP